MTFKSHLLAQGKSTTTLEHYVWAVEKFKAWLALENQLTDEVTSRDVFGYLAHLQKEGVSNATRRIRLTAINHYFDYQIKRERLSVHPSRHIKLKGIERNKLYTILSEEQLDSLYTTYCVPPEDDPNSKYNWFHFKRLGAERNRVILSLMVYQGLTTAEITRLELSDVQLREGLLFVKGSLKSEERTLELKPWQIIELMEYKQQTRTEIQKTHLEQSKHFFLSLPSGMGTKVKEGGLRIWQYLKTELRQQDAKFVNFQQLRASVIVHWLGKYNLRQVQTMAGHKGVSTTENYLSYKIEDLQEDIDKYHPF